MNTNTSSDSSFDAIDEGSASGHASEMLDSMKERISGAASVASETVQKCKSHYITEPAQDMFGMLKSYAKTNPDVCAMWCFGLGIVVGWKLRR
jgi:hypothetical protein